MREILWEQHMERRKKKKKTPFTSKCILRHESQRYLASNRNNYQPQHLDPLAGKLESLREVGARLALGLVQMKINHALKRAH